MSKSFSQVGNQLVEKCQIFFWRRAELSPKIQAREAFTYSIKLQKEWIMKQKKYLELSIQTITIT